MERPKIELSHHLFSAGFLNIGIKKVGVVYFHCLHSLGLGLGGWVGVNQMTGKRGVLCNFFYFQKLIPKNKFD